MIYCRFDATLSKCHESKHVAETLMPEALKNIYSETDWSDAIIAGPLIPVLTKQVETDTLLIVRVTRVCYKEAPIYLKYFYFLFGPGPKLVV